MEINEFLVQTAGVLTLILMVVIALRPPDYKKVKADVDIIDLFTSDGK